MVQGLRGGVNRGSVLVVSWQEDKDGCWCMREAVGVCAQDSMIFVRVWRWTYCETIICEIDFAWEFDWWFVSRTS